MTTVYVVMAIEAAAGGDATFALQGDKGDVIFVISGSKIVMTTLLAAFSCSGRVSLETVGRSRVVKRVTPFESARQAPSTVGEYRVNRIATQRNADGLDHLEAFLVRENDDQEKAVNVFDPLVQQLVVAAFAALGPIAFNLDAHMDNQKMMSARIGSFVANALDRRTALDRRGKRP